MIAHIKIRYKITHLWFSVMLLIVLIVKLFRISTFLNKTFFTSFSQRLFSKNFKKKYFTEKTSKINMKHKTNYFFKETLSLLNKH